MRRKPSRERTESYAPAEVRFLGEQDGTAESDLKDRVAPILRDSQAVRRAYLARVQYDNPVPAVALCLVPADGGVEDALLEKIASVFAGMFSNREHLDMIVVDHDQERELAQVCRPFLELP